jgi:hypothetical protein
VGPGTALDGCGKSHPCRDSIPGPSARNELTRSKDSGNVDVRSSGRAVLLRWTYENV